MALSPAEAEVENPSMRASCSKAPSFIETPSSAMDIFYSGIRKKISSSIENDLGFGDITRAVAVDKFPKFPLSLNTNCQWGEC